MRKISNFDKLEKKAKDIRSKILKLIVSAHSSHIGSAYSIVDILVYLYNNEFLNFNSKDNDCDKFILSKGWAVSALYAVLEDKGVIENIDLHNYCKDGSKFIGASTKNGIPGIEATTGSIGHGLPVGAGLAKGFKLLGKSNKVIVLLGDGECDEGVIWESALIAAQQKLDNLIVFIDKNSWQSFGKTKDVLNLEPLDKKFESFNWYVQSINGHVLDEIDLALKNAIKKKNKPSIIIAETIKGKGLSIIEDKNEFHYKTPTEAELIVAKNEGLI